MKKILMTLAFCAVATVANAAFTYIQGYVDAYEGDTNVADYQAMVVDSTQMGLTGAIDVNTVLDWVRDNFVNWSTPLNTSVAAQLTVASEGFEGGTLGFANESVNLTGNASQYYLLALCSGSGRFYLNVLANDITYNSSLDFDIARSESTGWQPIPEPTSGLLLLFGLAGLALKRRH